MTILTSIPQTFNMGTGGGLSLVFLLLLFFSSSSSATCPDKNAIGASNSKSARKKFKLCRKFLVHIVSYCFI